MGSARKIRNQRKKFDSIIPGTAAEDQGPGGWEREIDQGEQCESIDSRRPGLFRIDQGLMVQSIGKCNKKSKPEKFFTDEYQVRQQNTRDRVRGRWELSMRSGNKNRNQRKNFDRRRPG